MVCIVLNGKTLPHSEVLTERLCALNPHIASIVLNHNTQNTAVILGAECTVLWGAPQIADTLCGVSVRLSPLSFYQVNHDMAECLYRKAAEFADLDGSQTVLDLYCGTGTIGLSMANRAKRIMARKSYPPPSRTHGRMPAATAFKMRNSSAAMQKTPPRVSKRTGFAPMWCC